MNASPGWIDLELLLRTLAMVHARPLLLSMPIAGDFYDQRAFPVRLAKIITQSFARSCNDTIFPWLNLETHDEDPAFIPSQKSSHCEGLLTATRCWIYYNRALDDFYHERLPRS